jgi:transcription elongation GreA/GreB family factor
MRAEVHQSILQQLEEELRFVEQASKAAHEAATSEESKPENEYDTRALEASYLAEAQAKRAVELKRMIAGLRSMPRTGKTAVIESGSVVELDADGTPVFYAVLPFGAGLAATVNGKKVSVVTLESPLGQVIVGKKVGDIFEFRRSGSVKEFAVKQVF